MKEELKEKLKYIYNHFGYKEQKNHLQQELDEFKEQLTLEEYEGGHCYGLVEEMADVFVMLMEFKEVYCIETEELERIFEKKVERTLERIESGYYERKGQNEESKDIY